MNTTTLQELAGLLSQEGLLCNQRGDATTSITGTACDSREVREKNLFCCKGVAFKPAYLTSALEAGAAAYMCDETQDAELAELAPHTPALVVSDMRRAMALSSAVAWDKPDRKISVVGITGTKGKSTVAYMLRGMIDGLEPYSSAAIMGSIDTYDGIENFESHNTTPEAPELWRHLANAAESGRSTMVMEVSSQGLKYERVLGLDLDIACFLNIGQDHISAVEHRDFEDYFSSKLKIFSQARCAVVNLESDHIDRILDAAQACERVVTFSSTNPEADYWASDITPGFGYISFEAHAPSWQMHVMVGMAGLFNVDNALAALAMADLLGIDRNQAADALAVAKVPGRMEILPASCEQVVGIVDYAHNKLSFERFFSSMAQEFAGRRIIAVFGAAGGKAKERRYELPHEAAKWADVLIYTEEDPGPEDPADICAQMMAATPPGIDARAIPNRTEAIFEAVREAWEGPGDALVCLLAKGDETRQHVGDDYVPMETDGSVFARAMAEYPIDRS